MGFRLSGCYEIQQGVIVKKVKNLPGLAGLILLLTVNTGAILFSLLCCESSIVQVEFVSDSEGHMYTVLCFIV